MIPDHKVTKTVVIPAAGKGTRLAPASLAVPKELMPVFDMPAIHIVMEEAFVAGLTRIVVIRSPEKPSLIDYMLNVMANTGGERFLEEFELVDAIQEEPKGLGAALLEAEKYVEEDRFAVILPDGLFLGDSGGISELLGVAGQIDGSLVGLKVASVEQLMSSGAVAATPVESNVYFVTDITEKPNTDLDRYDFMILGRYILERSIFDAIRATAPNRTGEIELTDSLALTLRSKPLFGAILSNSFYDVGTPAGLLGASLKRADILGVRPTLPERDPGGDSSQAV